MQWIGLLIGKVLVIFCFVGSPLMAHATSRTSQQLERVQVRLDYLHPGSIIAKGHKIEGGCQFDPIDLILARGKWAVYRLDNSCSLILEVRWQGTEQDAPPPIRALLQRKSEGFQVPTQKNANINDNDQFLDQSMKADVGTLGVTCYTHKNVVYTYGGGGTPDKLTELQGWLTTCGEYEISSASTGGQCWAATWPPGWDWVYDGCYHRMVYVNSTSARAEQWGNYHCSPTNVAPCNFSEPDGYFHTLRLEQLGYSDGRGYCTRSAQGNYVFGPWGYNIQGCY